MSNGLSVRPAGMRPQSVDEAMRLSEALARTAMVPKDCQGKPQEILARILYGEAVGLAPLQAVNGVALVNGKPSLFGDALVAVARRHPEFVDIVERVVGADTDNPVATCTVTRRGQSPHTIRFSMADARRAGLAGKSGPWSSYPLRMLAARARGFALRDVFADALAGLITVEEAADYPSRSGAGSEPVPVPVVEIVPELEPEPEPVAEVIAEPVSEPVVDVAAVAARAIRAARTPKALEQLRGRIEQRVLENKLSAADAERLVEEIETRIVNLEDRNDG